MGTDNTDWWGDWISNQNLLKKSPGSDGFTSGLPNIWRIITNPQALPKNWSGRNISRFTLCIVYFHFLCIKIFWHLKKHFWVERDCPYHVSLKLSYSPVVATLYRASIILMPKPDYNREDTLPPMNMDVKILTKHFKQKSTVVKRILYHNQVGFTPCQHAKCWFRMIQQTKFSQRNTLQKEEQNWRDLNWYRKKH